MALLGWMLNGVARPVFAQTVPASGAAAGDGSSSGASAPRPSVDLTNQIVLRVSSFGVGGRGRPGDWVGVYLEVTDSADKARTVIVRMDGLDPDGDTAWLQRPIVTQPGDRRGVWLYTRLGSDSRPGAVFRFSAFEAIENAGVTDPRRKYSAGRLLGTTQYPWASPASPYSGLIGVVGSRGGGVEQYTWAVYQGKDVPPTGHEFSEPVIGLTPAGLPDRWMGLMAYETLVWTGSGVDEQPSTLRDDRAEAVREWVRRGGHLVIVLPPVGQQWIGTPHALADIMPAVNVERLEGIDLEGYRPLLTRDRKARMPSDAVVSVLTPIATSAGGYDAMVLMTGPKDQPVVVRRLVGEGAVTLIGLDVASRKLSESGGALQADHFWHRILGKRLALLPPQRLDDEIRGKTENKQALWSASRDIVEFDSIIGGLIAKSAKAAAGVLLAFAVFALYWLLAGPVGFLALKNRGKVQHAWVAFVAATAVFTIIGWTSANLIKTRRVEGTHLTILDSVFGQPTQRARSWTSLILPAYGQQRVSIASGVNEVGTHNAMSSWESQNTTSGTTLASFPDARGYVMDARQPDTADFPARSTVKQVQVDWSGVLTSVWGLPSPIAEAGTPVGQEIRVEDTQSTREPRWKLVGKVAHKLPASLTNVTVVYVRGVTRGLSSSSNSLLGLLPCEAYAVSLRSGDEWKADEPLDIGALFTVSEEPPIRRLSSMRAEELFKSLRGRASTFGVNPGLPGSDPLRDPSSALLGITFFSMLTPPEPVEQSGVVAARRSMTHCWDLSRWFTQPCVMIVGEMNEAPTPVPLSVDSETSDDLRKRVKGKTLVRWVYPLTPRPLNAEASRIVDTPALPDPN